MASPEQVDDAAGVVVVQGLNIAIGSLAERHLALIPLLYAATIGPGVIALAVIVGHRRRRRTHVALAGPA